MLPSTFLRLLFVAPIIVGAFVLIWRTTHGWRFVLGAILGPLLWYTSGLAYRETNSRLGYYLRKRPAPSSPAFQYRAPDGRAADEVLITEMSPAPPSSALRHLRYDHPNKPDTFSVRIFRGDSITSVPRP